MKKFAARMAKQWISTGWSEVNRAARWAKDQGYLGAKKLPVRTIGIGNVQAGGTGKTPLTIRIAQEAIARGLLVGILSRGYRSAWEKNGGMISPYDLAPSPELCGDEVALIRDRVPEVWIGVGADRFSQFERIQSAATLRFGKQFDLVLLDDALQHWKIECDQYVVAVTDSDFGSSFFREPYSAISEKDLVVLTKGSRFPSELLEHPNRVRTKYRLEGAEPSIRYHFVAALGDPERARKSLEEAGFQIEEMTVFPDHYAFDSLETERILEEAGSLGQRVLLSGKDWVKWRALGVPISSVQVVEPELDIIEGENIWRQVLWG